MTSNKSKEAIVAKASAELNAMKLMVDASKKSAEEARTKLAEEEAARKKADAEVAAANKEATEAQI